MTESHSSLPGEHAAVPRGLTQGAMEVRKGGLAPGSCSSWRSHLGLPAVGLILSPEAGFPFPGTPFRGEKSQDGR